MEIKIDQEMINAAIQKNANEAIAKALTGWKVSEAIANIITDEAADGLIADSVREAVRGIDTKGLASVLAVELQKHVTSAVVAIVKEGFIEAVLNLRKVPTYDDKARAEARKKVEAQLFS